MTPEQLAEKLFPVGSYTFYYRNIWIEGYNSRQQEVNDLSFVNKNLWAANKELNQEVDGLKAELESLSSDTRTLEEVLMDCLNADKCFMSTETMIDEFSSALKAMQEVERMAKAKYIRETEKKHFRIIDLENEIQSLQQQLSEHEKQYLEIAKIAREAAEENERLKAELDKARNY